MTQTSINGAALHMEQAVAQIRRKVAAVELDEDSFGVLSSGEKIAVALVLDRVDLLKSCGWGSILKAVDRLGPTWLEAALYVQRNGWRS